MSIALGDIYHLYDLNYDANGLVCGGGFPGKTSIHVNLRLEIYKRSRSSIKGAPSSFAGERSIPQIPLLVVARE